MHELLLTVLVVTVFFLELIGSQTIALGIASVVAPILSEVSKRYFNLSGFGAVALAAGVSAVIAIAATYFAGEAHTASEFVKNASAVFGVATIVYRAFTAATSPKAA